MTTGQKVLIRAGAVFLYLVFFFGVYLGLYVYLGNTITIQDSREYTQENSPEYFPVLVLEQGENGAEALVLQSLAREEYSGRSSGVKQSWQLYRQIEGDAGVFHSLPHVQGVKYNLQQLSGKRLQVVVAVGEPNNQRISTYTYDIENNRAYPRSYVLSSSFGYNFSPIPFLMMITGGLIYLVEKFVVRRLLKSSASENEVMT